MTTTKISEDELRVVLDGATALLFASINEDGDEMSRLIDQMNPVETDVALNYLAACAGAMCRMLFGDVTEGALAEAIETVRTKRSGS